LTVAGLDRNVCIPITLALPAPPHSPTSRLHWVCSDDGLILSLINVIGAVGRYVSFDSTPPPSPRHHRGE
jgi:hypothetical protein